MLKTDVVLNIFVKTDSFFQDSLINKKVKKLFSFCNNVNVFTVTFDQLNTSLLHKCNNLKYISY